MSYFQISENKYVKVERLHPDAAWGVCRSPDLSLRNRRKKSATCEPQSKAGHSYRVELFLFSCAAGGGRLSDNKAVLQFLSRHQNRARWRFRDENATGSHRFPPTPIGEPRGSANHDWFFPDAEPKGHVLRNRHYAMRGYIKLVDVCTGRNCPRRGNARRAGRGRSRSSSEETSGSVARDRRSPACPALHEWRFQRLDGNGAYASPARLWPLLPLYR